VGDLCTARDDLRAVSDRSYFARRDPTTDNGELRVELKQVLPLAEVAHAHELVERGNMRGRIALRVS
jgi:NADPH:quinone reductase-like Zn-dependent oxidoreductase